MRVVSVLCHLIVLFCVPHLHGQTEVRVLSEAPSFERATSDADLSTIYRENLEADFAPHVARGPQQLHNVLSMLETALRGKKAPRFLMVFVIKDNHITFVPLTAQPMTLAVKRAIAMRAGLENATFAGVRFPDTIFIMNTWDEARCGRRAPMCPVPVFALIKHWDWVRGTGLQYDVLLPFFNHWYQDIILYPWQQKKPSALMRAAMQNGMHRNCTRMWLLTLGKTAEGQRLLDVGITNNLKLGFRAPLVEPVSIPEHARWKYLISADGFAASCRFGKLLQINSVVLKEESRQIEYYYRSVKPHEHYVPFHKDNVMQVLTQLEAAGDAALQQISDAAQHFAYRYLSQHAKALYVRRAVEMYNSLFPNSAVETFVRQLDTTQLTLQTVMDALRQQPAS